MAGLRAAQRCNCTFEMLNYHADHFFYVTLGQLVMRKRWKKRNEEEGGTWLAVVGGGDKGFSRWGNNGDKGFTARSGG